MATPSSQEAEEALLWNDLDTDEIRSVDSDELHETRPNRWRGAPSEWHELTEEEQVLHQSMKSMRDHDLAIHLYNAFRLTNPAAGSSRAIQPSTPALDEEPSESASKLAEELQSAREWRPHPTWTAWPLPRSKVPQEQLLSETHDEYDRYTVRRKGEYRPGRVLEDEMIASVLRSAKDAFRSRGIAPDEMWATAAEEEAEREEEAASSRSSSPSPEMPTMGSSPPIPNRNAARDLANQLGRSSPVEGQASDSGERHSSDSEGGDEDKNGDHEEILWDPLEPNHEGHRKFLPIISADDEKSENILRPLVRHTLTQLERTLSTLHHIRMAANEASGDEDTPDDPGSEGSTASDSRLQRRKGTRSDSEDEHADEESVSDKEETILTNMGKQTARSSSTGKKKRKKKTTLRRHKKVRRTSNASSDDSVDQSEESDDLDSSEESSEELDLQDWRDVIGAAAFSGFAPDVVHRAAQRCADLFGQSAKFRKLEPTESGLEETVVHPGGSSVPSQTIPQDPNFEKEEVHPEDKRRWHRLMTISRRRLRERRRSRAAALGVDPDSLSEEEDFDTAEEGSGNESGRSRAESRSSFGVSGAETTGVEDSASDADEEIDIYAVEASSDGRFYCPVTSCRRHTKGFPLKRGLREHFTLVHKNVKAEKGTLFCPFPECKYHKRSFKAKRNLQTHLRTQHDGAEMVLPSNLKIEASGESNRQADGSPLALVEIAREDEMMGGIHRDGFLKPIKIQPGWLVAGGRPKGVRNKQSRS